MTGTGLMTVGARTPSTSGTVCASNAPSVLQNAMAVHSCQSPWKQYATLQTTLKTSLPFGQTSVAPMLHAQQRHQLLQTHQTTTDTVASFFLHSTQRPLPQWNKKCATTVANSSKTLTEWTRLMLQCNTHKTFPYTESASSPAYQRKTLTCSATGSIRTSS